MNIKLGRTGLNVEYTDRLTWNMRMGAWQVDESWFFGGAKLDGGWYVRLFGLEVCAWTRS